MPRSHGIDEPRLNFWLFAGFLVLVFLMGGASRPEALSQPLVRIVSVLALAFWALQLRGEQLRAARAPLLFLATAAAIVLVQLIPLPPGLWASLPGRAAVRRRHDDGGHRAGVAAAVVDPRSQPGHLAFIAAAARRDRRADDRWPGALSRYRPAAAGAHFPQPAVRRRPDRRPDRSISIKSPTSDRPWACSPTATIRRFSSPWRCRCSVI